MEIRGGQRGGFWRVLALFWLVAFLGQDDLAYAPIQYFEYPDELLVYIESVIVEPTSIIVSSTLYAQFPDVIERIRQRTDKIRALYVDQSRNPQDVELHSAGQGTLSEFSPGRVRPNREFSATPSDNEWNPPGNGLRRVVFDYAVQAVPSDVTATVLGNWTRLGLVRGGNAYPRLEMQSGGIMWATGEDAPTCLGRGTCQPVGGHSVWIAGSSLSDDQPQQYVAVSAQLDSTGFFPDMAYGSWQTTGSAALIAVADAFGRFRRSDAGSGTLQAIPIFFGFTAESYGYTGSGRFLEDLAQFECLEQSNFTENQGFGCTNPYVPSLRFERLRQGSSINSHIHIGPVGSGGALYAHTDANLNNNAYEELEAALNAGFQDGSLVIDRELDAEIGLPPTSSNSFARRRIPTVTISDYERTLDFNFFESMFDSPFTTPVAQVRDDVCAAANGLARTIVQLTHGIENADIEVNCQLVENVMDCFNTFNISECQLARDYLPEDRLELLNNVYDSLPEINFTQAYPSVFAPLPVTEVTLPTRLVRQSIMRYFLGERNAVEVTDTACTTDQNCQDLMAEINQGVTNNVEWKEVICARRLCTVTEAYYHQAYGTGLIAKDAGLNFFETDNTTNPAFTESRWGGFRDQPTGFCMQARDSNEFGALVVGMGVAVWVISAALLAVVTMFVGRTLHSDSNTTPLMA